MLAFPVERSSWTTVSRRSVPPARPGTDGRYRLTGFLEGDYYLAVVTTMDPDDGSDPVFLQAIVPGAIRMTFSRPRARAAGLVSAPLACHAGIAGSHEPANNGRVTADSSRRSRMDIRVYPSLAAHDRDDARFWADIPVAERVLQVWKLSEAQWRLRGEFPDESGFPRSVASVRRS